MRSFKSIFLLLLIVIPSTAYVAKDSLPDIGLMPGSTAPAIQIDKTGKELLSSMRGHYLLLQFWAAYDGQSRMNNLLMYNSITKHYADRVLMASFSFDSQKLIFDETLRSDGISASTQYFVEEGSNSEIFRTYSLANGYANYLIDPNGVIVAKDVSPQKLEEILN
ncbi:MAG: thioredoxin-like domain-containing protein [Bacteroidales bacterium]